MLLVVKLNLIQNQLMGGGVELYVLVVGPDFVTSVLFVPLGEGGGQYFRLCRWHEFSH